MKIRPFPGSSNSGTFIAQIFNPPRRIVSVSIKGYGQSGYTSCTMQNLNLYMCYLSGTFTEPASIILNHMHYGYNIIDRWPYHPYIVLMFITAEDKEKVAYFSAVAAIVVLCLILIGCDIVGGFDL